MVNLSRRDILGSSSAAAIGALTGCLGGDRDDSFGPDQDGGFQGLLQERGGSQRNGYMPGSVTDTEYEKDFSVPRELEGDLRYSDNLMAGNGDESFHLSYPIDGSGFTWNLEDRPEDIVLSGEKVFLIYSDRGLELNSDAQEDLDKWRDSSIDFSSFNLDSDSGWFEVYDMGDEVLFAGKDFMKSTSDSTVGKGVFEYSLPTDLVSDTICGDQDSIYIVDRDLNLRNFSSNDYFSSGEKNPDVLSLAEPSQAVSERPVGMSTREGLLAVNLDDQLAVIDPEESQIRSSTSLDEPTEGIRPLFAPEYLALEVDGSVQAFSRDGENLDRIQTADFDSGIEELMGYDDAIFVRTEDTSWLIDLETGRKDLIGSEILHRDPYSEIVAENGKTTKRKRRDQSSLF